MPKIKPCDLPNLIKTSISPQLYKQRININKKKGVILNPNIPNGKYTYVIRKSKPKHIFMIDKKTEKKYYIQHNVLAEGGNVLIAGEMEVNDNLISFDNYSGHYEPKKSCLNYLKDLLINEYGFKYVTTNKKQLTHFMKITMVFDSNLWEGRRKVIHGKSKRSNKSNKSKRNKRRIKSKRSRRKNKK